MQVDDVSWNSLVISETSNYPCDTNVVSVTVTPDIDLYASCVRFIQISGFVGTMTDDDSSLELTDADAALSSSALWEQEGGVIKVSLDSDMSADMPYAFSFTLR